MKKQKKILILGIGNVLWADEGFGVRTLEYLKRSYQFPENVQLMDGGTQGIYLVQHIRECDVLVVFDAVDYALPAGSLKVVEGDAVPKFLGVKKVSLHQTGFQEVLAMAEMLGDYPEKLLLIGVQPEDIEDYGGSLTPCVKEQMQSAIQIALDYLVKLGSSYQCRSIPLLEDARDGTEIAAMDSYEQQRPSQQQAYRFGDQRVLHSGDYTVAYQPFPLDGNALGVGIDQHLDQYRSIKPSTPRY